MTSRRQGVALALFAIATACLSTRCSEPASPASPALPALAESYVRLALKLAQHDPELVDGWRGPETWKPGPRQPVAPLLAEVETLQRELGLASGDGEGRHRLDYLTAQVNALHLSAERLLGKSARFSDEAHAAFGIDPAPFDPLQMETTRAALERELPGHGPLADRYASFKRRLAIRPARVEAVMRAALDVCRTATISHVTLPPDENINLVLVSGSPWDGYARYEGKHRTRVEINRNAALDITRALRLACHEGYPGHHLQYIWIDDKLVSKREWKEFLLSPAFGRHLLITEGAAEAGVDVLFPDHTRTEVYRKTLLPIAGIAVSEAARIVRIESLVSRLEPVIAEVIARYLDNSLTQSVAADRLRTEALSSNPDALLAFAERRRTRVSAYAEGRALVLRLIGHRGFDGLRQVFVDRPFAIQ